MAKAFLALNTVEECRILPVAPPEAGSKRSRFFTVSGSANADGLVKITVNGTRLEAAVSAGDGAAAVTAAIAAKVNSDPGLPVEAVVKDDTELRLVSLAAGYLSGHTRAEITADASGITVTQEEASGGSGGGEAIDIQAAFPAIGNIRFNYIVWAFCKNSKMEGKTYKRSCKTRKTEGGTYKRSCINRKMEGKTYNSSCKSFKREGRTSKKYCKDCKME